MNSSKPTDIKLSNKDLLKKEDEDEKIINKANSKFLNSDSNSEKNWEKAVEIQKERLIEQYGACATSLIKKAELNTEERLYDMSHYWDYLYGAMKNEEKRYIKFDLKPQQEAQKNAFYIPMDGPWNA